MCVLADELIRQVTLDSPERGLLCLRVRDEIRMTIDAYKTLFDSSVTFGIKKQLQAEQGVDEMEESVSEKKNVPSCGLPGDRRSVTLSTVQVRK